MTRSWRKAPRAFGGRKDNRPDLERLRRDLDSAVDALDRSRAIYFGHLGLGDQISAALAIEAWASRVPSLMVPVKPRNLRNVEQFLAYIPNVEVVSLPSDNPAEEVIRVQQMAARSGAGLIQAGRSTYGCIAHAFPEYGINRRLLLCGLVSRSSAVSARFRSHVLSLSEFTSPLEEEYVFVDHHPGTEREIPMQQLSSWPDSSRVMNPSEVPLYSLATVMEHAAELHLVSSAPLCLALTADLGQGRRVRYRVGNHAPLRLDYPLSWEEIALDQGSMRRVDRAKESQQDLSPTRLQAEIRELIHQVVEAAAL